MDHRHFVQDESEIQQLDYNKCTVDCNSISDSLCMHMYIVYSGYMTRLAETISRIVHVN